MSSCPVFLLGTVHRDTLGFRRLSAFLHEFKPDCILLELSPYGLNYRTKNRANLQQTLNHSTRETSRRLGLPLRAVLKHPEVLAIRRQISLPFEYRATRRYSSSSGAPLHLVDHSRWSRNWVRHWPQLISRENIETLVTLERAAPPAVSQIYQQAAFRIAAPFSSRRGGAGGADRLAGLSALKRERSLAKRIFRFVQALAAKRPLFVGGWMHLTHGVDQPHLRDYLGTPTSRCGLLDRGMLGA